MTEESQRLLYQAVQATRPLLRHITSTVEAGLEKHNISVGQRAVMEVLLEQPLSTAPELTRYLDLKRQFVARMIGELEQKALIASVPNPSHKRAHRYQLTKAGETAIRDIRQSETETLSEFLGAFSASDIATHHKIQTALVTFFANQAKGKKP